jgi:hypothetical protein
MARFQGADGVVVETFDDVDVVFPRLGTGRGGPTGGSWEANAILDAAAFGGTVTRVEIAPSGGPVPPAQRGARGAGAAKPVTIEVAVGEGQNAALLVESEGVFQWRFPDAPDGLTPARINADRGPGGRRVLRFRVGDAEPLRTTQTRGGFVDLVGDAIFDRVRAYVLKFVARKGVVGLREYLERDLVEGLVDMTGEPAGWKSGGAPPVPAWPTDRPARLLLAIHGTFSSTLGSFGALTATDAGKNFLADARKRYDAIIGFDHSTLAADPMLNAEEIARGLDSLAPPKGAFIDVIAYSRGGLVARALSEGLLEKRLPDLRVGRVVFVGGTNGGTQLAEPENWRSLLDLTTNLAAAAGRVLKYIGYGLAGTIVSESVKTIGGLVQAIVDQGVDPNELAGLAAMRPSSQLISTLDAVAVESPNPPDYYALGSHFRAKIFSEGGGVEPPRGVSTKLALTLANFASSGVMKKANDLVVDNDAMQSFGARAGRLKTVELWGDNVVMYHLNYFQQREIIEAMEGFLLEDPPATAAIVAQNAPVFNAEDLVGAVRARRAEAEAHPAIVIERALGQVTLYYVRTASDLLTAIDQAEAAANLEQALELHEWDATPTGEVVPTEIKADGFVLTEKGALIGVVPPLGSAALRPSTVTKAEKVVIGRVPGPIAVGRYLPGVNIGTRWLRRGGDDGELVSYKRIAPERLDNAERKEEEPTVDCHFMAEMAPTPPLGRDAPLSVTVARESLTAFPGAIAASGVAPVAAEARLVIEITPLANCEIVSLAKIDIVAPAKGQPKTYDFAIRGTAAGPAEIWVDVRNGARRLARLVLQPTFVPTEKLQVSASAVSAEQDKPVVNMRIYDITQGPNAFSLQFDLESRELGFLLQKRTQTFGFSREAYVGGIYDKLERAWISSARDQHRFMLQFAPYVAELYTEIVPPEIRQALWDNRKMIGSIEVMSQEPFIPWEILQLVEPGKSPEFEAPFLAQLGLVRWIANTGFAPASLRLRDGAAYHVIPDYVNPDRVLSAARDERDMLKQLFASRPAPTNSLDLVYFLRGGNFDLIHFACHGNVENTEIYNANLELQDCYDDRAKAYIPDLLTSAQVRSYADLRARLPDRPIVFINACETGQTGRALVGVGGMAEAFVSKGAGAVVAALWSVGDDAAFAFAKTFYETMLEGRTLAQATLDARDAARKSELGLSWLAYTVYGHPYARLRLGAEKPAIGTPRFA